MTKAASDKPTAHCLYCNELFELKRADKKFCTEACKTAYHNDKRYIPQPVIVAEPEEEYDINIAALKRVYNILISSRIALHNMKSLYQSQIALNDFYGFGVNLKYFTSEYKDEDGRVFRMCFDYGYCIAGEQVYLVYSGAEIHFN